MEPGLLVILTGATASGKDTIADLILQKFPSFHKVITTTTRKPRPNEAHTINHYFVSEKKFHEMQRTGELLESVNYAGNFYGTTKKALQPIFEGQNLIWRIDASAAARIKNILPKDLIKHTLIFYIHISKDEQKKRLEIRGMDKKDIKARLIQDEKAFQLGHFKRIINNPEGKLDTAVDKIVKIISSYS